jgi:choice-of-anchor A domain-containing protein
LLPWVWLSILNFAGIALGHIAIFEVERTVNKIMFRVCIAVALVGIPVSRSTASLLPNYNLVVFGNLSDSSDVEGTAIVGGDFTGSAANFGTKLSQATTAGTDVLTIVGNLDGGATTNIEAGGNLRIGGSVNGTVNLNGSGGSIVHALPIINMASLQSSMIGLSNSLNALSANSTVTLPGAQPSNIVFNADFVNNIAVFDVNASDIFENSKAQQILLNIGSAVPADSTIIINVAGSDINFDEGNFGSEFNDPSWSSQILWNFNGATALNVANTLGVSREFWGSVLAPSADTTLSTTSPIDGTVVVGSANLQGEIHLPQFAGNVPEPTCLTLIGVCGILLRRRR